MSEPLTEEQMAMVGRFVSWAEGAFTSAVGAEALHAALARLKHLEAEVKGLAGDNATMRRLFADLCIDAAPLALAKQEGRREENEAILALLAQAQARARTDSTGGAADVRAIGRAGVIALELAMRAVRARGRH